jgi:hypothetical protein
VDEGGHLESWYGRKILDEAHTVAKVAWSDKNADYVEKISID